MQGGETRRLRRIAAHLVGAAQRHHCSPQHTHAHAQLGGAKLVTGYWNTRGIGAPLRMMCEYAGVPYEAKLFDNQSDEWPQLKAELAEKVRACD